eukprot:COSAG01_NODE_204_length_22090_cov_64.189441_1_plen_41_part_10
MNPVLATAAHLKKVLWFKANVPAELRVSGTIFNAMTLVGDL